VSVRAVDARFLLSGVPRSARVVGDLPEWRAGLATAGIDIVENDRAEPPDLVVAPASQAAAALEVGAQSYLFLGGAVRRVAPGSGLRSTVYLAVPDLEAPEYLVPLDQARTIRYFFDYLRIAPSRAQWYRNRLTARLMGVGNGFPVRDDRLVTMVGFGSSVPAAVRVAATAAGRGASGWLLSLGPTHAERRAVFTVFVGTTPMPDWVAKFDRLASLDADERPVPAEHRLTSVLSSVPLLDEHMPHPLGEVTFDGRATTIEAAAAGYLLTDFLRGPFARSRKMAAVDEVAQWLVALAIATAIPPDHPEDRARGGGLPDATSVGPAAAATLSGAPRVLEHGDLWSGNVVIRPGRPFVVIDWEDADPRGYPLRDLLYFLSETLAVADGASTDGERDTHFRSLFRGELPSSQVVFGWVRTMADGLGIDPDQVGPLVAHGWEDLALRRREGLATTSAAIIESMGPEPVEPAIRRAELWSDDPALGERWSAWRGAGEGRPSSGAGAPADQAGHRVAHRARLRIERSIGSASWAAAHAAARDVTEDLHTARLLVFAPHPDDETLACGGCIARAVSHGRPVHIAVATDGRHARHDIPPEEMATIRAAELAAALAALGVAPDQVEQLGFEDGTLADHSDALAVRAGELVTAFGPTVVLSPWAHDTHSDHAALGRAVRVAMAGRGIPLLEYVVWAWTTPLRLMHQAFSPSSRSGSPPRPLLPRRPVQVRTDRFLQSKVEALAAHGSQLGPSAGTVGLPDADGPLDAEFLGKLLGPVELFLPRR
jgi:LmbE family N-acetylglucosaminyl deacetylase